MADEIILQLVGDKELQAKIVSFREKLPGFMKDAHYLFYKHMVGEIRNRVAHSFDPEKGPWLGIKYSSLNSSSRSDKGKSRARGALRREVGGKIAKEIFKGKTSERVPVGTARPLVTGSGEATQITASWEGFTLRLAPTMRGDGKVDSILVYHHRPEITGVGRTGRPPSPMPDRSFFFLTDKDIQWAEKKDLAVLDGQMNRTFQRTAVV